MLWFNLLVLSHQQSVQMLEQTEHSPVHTAHIHKVLVYEIKRSSSLVMSLGLLASTTVKNLEWQEPSIWLTGLLIRLLGLLASMCSFWLPLSTTTWHHATAFGSKGTSCFEVQQICHSKAMQKYAKYSHLFLAKVICHTLFRLFLCLCWTQIPASSMPGRPPPWLITPEARCHRGQLWLIDLEKPRRLAKNDKNRDTKTWDTKIEGTLKGYFSNSNETICKYSRWKHWASDLSHRDQASSQGTSLSAHIFDLPSHSQSVGQNVESKKWMVRPILQACIAL